MRVAFDDSVLRDPTWAPELVAIVAICAMPGSPHRLVGDSAQVGRWAREYLPQLARLVETTVELGNEDEDGYGRRMVNQLTVAADAPARWRRPAAQALRLLRRPYLVVLENGFSDAAFLRAFATAAERSLMECWLRDGWLELRGVGGNDQVAQCARDVVRRGEDDLFRSYFLMDSDRRHDGDVPSEPAQELARLVRTNRLLGHVLEGRSIENYAPTGVLLKWVQLCPGPAQAKRKRFARALARLRWSVRAFLDLKHGARPERNNEALLELLPSDTRPALVHGLTDFAWEFYRVHHSLEHETDELRRMIETILEQV